MKGKHQKKPERGFLRRGKPPGVSSPAGGGSAHRFLRRVVRLCLVMMVILTLATVAMCMAARMPPDAASLGVLMGGWCGELLLTLLKRKFEIDDKAAEDQEKEKEESE